MIGVRSSSSIDPIIQIGFQMYNFWFSGFSWWECVEVGGVWPVLAGKELAKGLFRAGSRRGGLQMCIRYNTKYNVQTFFIYEFMVLSRRKKDPSKRPSARKPTA